MSIAGPDGESIPDPGTDGSGNAIASLVSPAASSITDVLGPVDSGWSRGGC